MVTQRMKDSNETGEQGVNWDIERRGGLAVMYHRMTVTIVAATLLLAAAVHAEPIALTVGEMRILRPGDIERVAVGMDGLISFTLLKNGQLLVFGEAPGVTTLHLWFKNGNESDLEVVVDASERKAAANSGVLRQKFTEIDGLIGDIPGLEMSLVGDRIVLSGQYDDDTSGIASIKAAYPEILDLSITTRFIEVRELLGHIPDLDIRVVGDRIVLTGTIDDGFEGNISTVMGVYDEIMDLTRKEVIDLPDEKMVLMNVKITEFNISASDSLGINWTTNFAGPAAALSSETGFGGSRVEGVTVLGNSNTPGSLAAIDPAGAQAAFGYFGIATEISSRINMAVSNGDALILAEPRLVARSGGEATFLAGGEVPIEIVTPTSASIEFKQFGILLNIRPEVDRKDNIRANVETEISAIDQSVSIGNTPGFLTRRTTADILLQSGETLVMSGLVDTEIGKDITGLAGFRSIPVLGALFRSKDFRESKTDLVIFVTPQVYDAAHQQNIEAIARQDGMVNEFLDSVRKSSYGIVD